MHVRLPDDYDDEDLFWHLSAESELAYIRSLCIAQRAGADNFPLAELDRATRGLPDPSAVLDELETAGLWAFTDMHCEISCPWPYRTPNRAVLQAIRRGARAMFGFLAARDGEYCQHCGATDRLEVDHIVPLAKTLVRANDPGNLQLLCKPCNASKGGR
jgi:hypothetical protein